MNFFKNQKNHWISILFVLFMIFLAGGSNDSSSSSSSISVGEHRISGSNYIGCRSKETFEKMIQYAVQRDNEAFKRMLAAGLFTGECTTLTSGETVYVVETAVLKGMVKIRRKGEIIEYWTQIEAIK